MKSYIYRRFGLPLIMIAALVAAGCSSRKYDGEWEGATSGGHTLKFTVSGGSITMTRVEFDISCERSGMCPGGGLIEEDIGASVSGNSFSTVIDGKATFAGKFDSETAASGELNVQVTDPNCGACKGNTTWTAKKL
jgi:hypothetical protein